MKRARGHPGSFLLAALLAAALASVDAQAQESEKWSIDPSLYLFFTGMTGTIGIVPVEGDVNVGFDSIVKNLKFGAMGSVRVGRGPWAFTTQVIYANLEATKSNVTASMHQLVVEPTVSYRANSWLEPLAGFRYYSVGGDLNGPSGNNHAATQGWFDPIIGVNLQLALTDSVSADLRGDVGGFGIGSKLTWQVFPYVSWRVAKILSLQAGYRVLAIDYEGSDRFLYDVIESGPQIGVTFLLGL